MEMETIATSGIYIAEVARDNGGTGPTIPSHASAHVIINNYHNALYVLYYSYCRVCIISTDVYKLK